MTPQDAKKCFLWNMMEDLNLYMLLKFSQMKLTWVDGSPCICDSLHDFWESYSLLSKKNIFRTQSVLSIGPDTSHAMYIYNTKRPHGRNYLPHFTDREMVPQRDSIIYLTSLYSALNSNSY